MRLAQSPLCTRQRRKSGDRQLGASSGIAAIRVLNPERAMAKRVLLAQSAWR